MSESRYLRQVNAFPHERRRQTLVAELGGLQSPLTSRFLKAGAAAAGVARVAADFHGVPDGSHWFLSGHELLVRSLNAEVGYDYLDPQAMPIDLRPLAEHANGWAVLHAANSQQLRRSLEQLRQVGLPMPVLLSLCGPGGLVIARASDAAAAEGLLAGNDWEAGLPPNTETCMVAAGLMLNEILRGVEMMQTTPGRAEIIAGYSLHRPRRIDVPLQASLAELAGEVLQPPARRTTYTGRRFKQVGAGALGNWLGLGLALEGGVCLEIVDGDLEIEPHNLNRQLLLIDGVGLPKAPVLAAELARLDPSGTYLHEVQFVEQAADLGRLTQFDALLLGPDNNHARLIGAEAAWRQGVLCAQGGSSAAGGQMSVHEPGRACYTCVTGVDLDAALRQRQAGSQSCNAVADDSIVTSNMIVSGLMLAELRETLSGRRSQNLRFFGDVPGGNRLVRMASDPPCSHK